MTEQTHKHYLLERLLFINPMPRCILADNVAKAKVQKIYPEAEIFNLKQIKSRPDLIMADIFFSEEIFNEYRKRIAPSGLLLFVLKTSEGMDIDLQALGDFLSQLGFEKIVVDTEDARVYGHACAPAPINIKIHEIRRGGW